jgi:hypothetical protein
MPHAIWRLWFPLLRNTFVSSAYDVFAMNEGHNKAHPINACTYVDAPAALLFPAQE